MPQRAVVVENTFKNSETRNSETMNDVPTSRIELFFEKTVGKLGVYQTMRPLVVGLVHGLAGSAAVALLVLSTIKSPLWSTAYLLVFGFGTMMGMMLMTAAISIPMVYTGKRFFNINRHLAVISGFASMAFGVFLVLPHRFCRRAVYFSSALDPAITRPTCLGVGLIPEIPGVTRSRISTSLETCPISSSTTPNQSRPQSGRHSFFPISAKSTWRTHDVT